MQTTPLYPVYEKYGARIVDFHGWTLPIQFSGIIDEHLAVRNQAGLFDVSHMGEIKVNGPQSSAFLEHLLTNEMLSLKPGRVRYSPLCLPDGGTIDDLLVYCLASDHFLLVVNASNIEKDFDWISTAANSFDITVANQSAQTAQLAIQGPQARVIMAALTDKSLPELRYYHFIPEISLQGIPVLLSRTGYTGEDGYEIYLRPADAIPLWKMLMTAGQPYGLKPIGLGARDTLRFEAALPLYGNELSETISPLEAGLERFVELNKPDFIGREALLQQSRKGPQRRLAGLIMTERGIPRSGCRVFVNNEPAGIVTSGSYAPSLRQNLALALIPAAVNLEEASLQVEIRDKMVSARPVPLPFYSRPKGAVK